jgi:hypothetical protein
MTCFECFEQFRESVFAGPVYQVVDPEILPQRFL